MRQELSKVIQVGMGTLPPEQRVALVLSDVQGLSYQEIAEATGVSLGTVKSRSNRARIELARAVHNLGSRPGAEATT